MFLFTLLLDLSLSLCVSIAASAHPIGFGELIFDEAYYAKRYSTEMNVSLSLLTNPFLMHFENSTTNYPNAIFEETRQLHSHVEAAHRWLNSLDVAITDNIPFQHYCSRLFAHNYISHRKVVESKFRNFANGDCSKLNLVEVLLGRSWSLDYTILPVFDSNSNCYLSEKTVILFEEKIKASSISGMLLRDRSPLSLYCAINICL